MRYLWIFAFTFLPIFLWAQIFLIQAERLFDGEAFHDDWSVVITDGLITEIGPHENIDTPVGAMIYQFGSQLIMPVMIEGHSHILLHPYNETSWNDQVLKESKAERILRASNHLFQSLEAGFTTLRDLGSEGAGYADVGIKESIEKGIISGPDLFVAGPAIVSSGSYGPKGFASNVQVPKGAEEADGYEGLIQTVRRQIGGGADFIKVYADYRWGPNGGAMPTFTLEELKLIVEVAHSSGRKVAAHAATSEGMRRATLACVYTIEHGDGGSTEIFELMKEHNVSLCPTLAAGDAIMQYRGWRKGMDPEPERIARKKESFAKALKVGVPIVAGGDVGVFAHGENVRELELMVDYGMSTIDVIRNITSVNADLLGYQDRGLLRKGLKADIIAINGDPIQNISDLTKVSFVMKDGKVVVDDN